MRNIAAMMQKAKQLQGDLADIKQEIAEANYSASAGNGAVFVEANGNGLVTKITLNIQATGLQSDDDVGLLEDLITVAVNQVRTQAEDDKAKKIKEVTGDLPLPAGLDFPI